QGVMERRVIESSARGGVGSEFARRQLHEDLGARVEHVDVVPYGVDARFAPRPARADLRARYGLGGHPVVLFFGGLKPRKNLPLLPGLLARVVAETPAARLFVSRRRA